MLCPIRVSPSLLPLPHACVLATINTIATSAARRSSARAPHSRIAALSTTLANLFAAPVFGVGINLTSTLVEMARDHCGCGPITSLMLVGSPGLAVSFSHFRQPTRHCMKNMQNGPRRRAGLG